MTNPACECRSFEECYNDNNLSEKECNVLTNHIDLNNWSVNLTDGKHIIKLPKEELKFEKGFFKEDIKEFIKRLKEETIRGSNVLEESIKMERLFKLIDKLAGEKLK